MAVHHIPERIQELARKWRDGTINETEKQEFTAWYNDFDDESAAVDTDPEKIYHTMLSTIRGRIDGLPQKRTLPPILRYAAAAVFLLLTGTSIWLLTHHTANKDSAVIAQTTPPPARDIAPGGARAILTLSNGRQIQLDSTNNNETLRQGNTEIKKTGQASLVYHADNTTPPSATPEYNTLSTPRGGIYELQLPDGTRAWLNSASSITYPVSFAAERRDIRVTGEVFLEVAADPHKPFYVTARDGVGIEVLGTSFNLNAYADENTVNTTLLTGSLRVTEGGGPGILLHPGQQTQSASGQKTWLTDHADIAMVTAWKQGLFQFHEASLPTVLKQIARWYDVDIHYEGEIPVREFEGRIQRSLSLLQVLHILEKNEPGLRLEGRTIIVKK